MLRRSFVGLVAGAIVGCAAGLSLAPPCVAAADQPLREIARIAVGAEPLGIDVAPDGKVIVAAAAGRSLHVLDPIALRETHKLDLSSHGRLSRVFVDRTSGEIFVTASVKGQVLKLDSPASSVLAAVTTGGFPQGITQVGGKLLVALTGGQAVSVLDRATLAPLRSLDAGDRPISIHVDRNGEAFYVVKSTTRSVWVFDAVSLKWIRSISDPSLVRPSGLTQAPDGRLLLLDAAQDALLVLDAQGAAIETRIPLLSADCGQCTHVPMALAVSPDGGRVAVVGRGGWISLIELKTRRLAATLRAGRDLRGVVWAGDDRIFATSFATGEVVVLDGREG